MPSGDGEGHGRGHGPHRPPALPPRRARPRRARVAPARARLSGRAWNGWRCSTSFRRIEHFERADMEFALGYYHWFWFAQPHPFPENADQRGAGRLVAPAHHARRRARRTCSTRGAGRLPRGARAPANIRGMCEDYRAAATIDLVHDRASRAAGHKRALPRCWCCGARRARSAPGTTRSRSGAHMRGPKSAAGRSSGHYIAEEAPEETLAALEAFLG